MPSILKFGWDAIASKFVSENTLKKIKITKEMMNADMWTHIDKKSVERKFGGTMEDLTADFWPPSKQLLNLGIESAVQNVPLTGHITKENYEGLYMSGRLAHRKVYGRFIEHLRNQKTRKKT